MSSGAEIYASLIIGASLNMTVRRSLFVWRRRSLRPEPSIRSGFDKERDRSPGNQGAVSLWQRSGQVTLRFLASREKNNWPRFFPNGWHLRMNKISDPSGIEAAAHGALANRYNALLIVGFGGPEKPKRSAFPGERDTWSQRSPRTPTRGRRALRSFRGKSPINAQVRELMARSARTEAARRDHADLWGNRNWNPLLADTLRNGPVGVRTPWPWSWRRTVPIPVAASIARTSSRPDGSRTHCVPDRQDARLL